MFSETRRADGDEVVELPRLRASIASRKEPSGVMVRSGSPRLLDEVMAWIGPMLDGVSLTKESSSFAWGDDAGLDLPNIFFPAFMI